MAANCRFAFAVHVLSVLASHPESGVTSDKLAASVNTNPVVIRRLLTTLRRAGFICTQKGARTGSRLCHEPGEITLDQIYRAVESGPSFSPHPHTPNQKCPVGQRIEMVLTEVFASAQSALEHALSERSLADVVETMQTPGRASSGSRGVRRPR
ncbi:MAG: Rrf2 family transcriptional regulator [Chthoniobacteraceae bacterium]